MIDKLVLTLTGRAVTDLVHLAKVSNERGEASDMGEIVDRAIANEKDRLSASLISSEIHTYLALNYRNPDAWLKSIEQVALNYWNIHACELHTKRRPAQTAWRRQVVMWLQRTFAPSLTLESIGSYWNKDHGTVIHACRVVENRMCAEPNGSDAHDAETLRERVELMVTQSRKSFNARSA